MDLTGRRVAHEAPGSGRAARANARGGDRSSGLAGAPNGHRHRDRGPPGSCPPSAEDGGARTLSNDALRELRLAELDRAWSDLELARSRGGSFGPLSVAQVLMTASKPVLDELGYGQPIPQGLSRPPPGVTEYSFGDTQYFSPEQALPIWGRYQALLRRHQDMNDPRPRTPAEAQEAEDYRFEVDDEFMAELSALLEQARAAIRRRETMY